VYYVVGSQPPALASLAADIRLAGFALRVQRGEGEIEVMIGRLAGIDCATHQLWHGSVHRISLRGQVITKPGARASRGGCRLDEGNEMAHALFRAAGVRWAASALLSEQYYAAVPP
jgi:hypothetical protein